jgi:hypothetical protein
MLLERKEHKNPDETIGYIESVFNSDNVLKTTYFPKDKRLYIAFSRGHTYSYSNISEEFYNEFEKSGSQGKFFHERINKNYRYPYRKEFTLYPTEVNEIKIIVKEKLQEIENNKEDGKDTGD